jgi:hypothetical protein
MQRKEHKAELRLVPPEKKIGSVLWTPTDIRRTQNQPGEVCAIREMLRPTDVKGVQQLLCVVNYLPKSYKHLSDKCVTGTADAQRKSMGLE